LIFDVWILNFMKHIKIKKITIVVFGLWSLVFGLNLALAQQEPPPYPTGYWIMGQLDGTAVGLSGAQLDGFTVIFYKTSTTPWTAFATGVTYDNGKFLINAHDDLRLFPLIAGNYYIGVGKRQIDSRFYGKNETVVAVEATDLQNGYKNIGSLALAENEGVWVPSPEVWEEDPHVRNLRIRRFGSDIVVEWDKEPPDYTGNFYVFRRVGAFENLPTNWNDGINVGNNVSYTDTGQVGGGNGQVYYRVLSTSDKNALVNKVAVGKVNVVLEASGLKLVTCPFNDGKVSFVFPGQMADGVSYKLYPRSGSGLDVVTVTRAGVSGQDFNVVPTVGFWIRNESANSVVITFCGSLEAPYQKDLASLDLTGNPLPASLASSGLGGESGDTLYHQSGRGLNPLVKTTTWPAYTLSVGEGFWYRKSAERARYWDVNILGLSAQIKSR